MPCESVAAALIEGRPPSPEEAAHTRVCPACQRLERALRTLPPPLHAAPPPAPARVHLDRAVGRARIREAVVGLSAAALLLGFVASRFVDPPPAAPPLVAEALPDGPSGPEAADLAPPDADAALLAALDVLATLESPPEDFASTELTDLLDPYPQEPLVQFGEL
jgi:hypothetical protein